MGYMGRARGGVGVCLMARLRNQDNSGPVVLKHIGMFHRKKTHPGQKFTASIFTMAKQQAKLPGQSRMQKGQVKHSVMLTMRAITYRNSGITVQFGRNTAAMVDLTNGKNVPLGDRIVGPIAMEVAKARLWQKLLDVQEPKCLR
eukprot:GGOE01049207.1.p2 GENE.GGOE01049207.1~~GGOE01049207.1.p2  ORF type:complete len:158 (+),score=32.26 GGOE01049207.1:44-475(+)